MQFFGFENIIDKIYCPIIQEGERMERRTIFGIMLPSRSGNSLKFPAEVFQS